ncbi:MAG: hypothetical protein E7467_05325 [Ruminococcaceae bacterium]|nr:hypothetical protein [Oscillospiraceae bacterium]
MLFRKKIEKSCSYCVHAAKIDETTILCAKKGMLNSTGHCRKFKYDPLKRTPPKAKPQDFEEYDRVDFSL